MSYTMFAWFDVSRWPDGYDFEHPELPGISAVQAKIDSMDWPTNTHIDFHGTNASDHLVMHAHHNHGYGVPEQVAELMRLAGREPPRNARAHL